MDIDIPLEYRIASAMHLISLMTGIDETNISVYVSAYRSDIQFKIENGATVEEVAKWFISEASDNPNFLRCTIDEELNYERPTGEGGGDISNASAIQDTNIESPWEPTAEVFKVDPDS